MYSAFADPFCYPGTAILKNRLGIRDQPTLDKFEAEITAQRAEEPLPVGRLSITHFCNIHHHLFQDVYVWAGRYRTTRISKDQATFCYPENIVNEMKALFAQLKRQTFLRGLSRAEFSKQAAHFLSHLNAIHPFREGNGRTQNVFIDLLAEQAGHPLDFDAFERNRVINAMARSFFGDEGPLRNLIHEMCAGGTPPTNKRSTGR